VKFRLSQKVEKQIVGLGKELSLLHWDRIQNNEMALLPWNDGIIPKERGKEILSKVAQLKAMVKVVMEMGSME
jgi:hypothetical protein